MADKTKRCGICSEWKPVVEFYTYGAKPYLSTYCKTCHNTMRRHGKHGAVRMLADRRKARGLTAVQ